jgi:hypothetical protein
MHGHLAFCGFIPQDVPNNANSRFASALKPKNATARALAAATVGLAMGTETDVAVESAGIRCPKAT